MKKIIGAILISIWRIWFYLLVLIPILIMMPLLVIAISKEKYHPYFYKLARIWAYIIYFGMGFQYNKEMKQLVDAKKSYMFIANHSSMMDIMLMFILLKNPFVFVGKIELSKMPIFGFIYKRTAIMVDRSSPESRRAVFEDANRRIKQGTSICIFPEGGVPDRSVLLDGFKKGAFRLAIEHQLPIVPITFCGLKKYYPFEWFVGKPAKIKVTFHEHIEVTDLTLGDVNQIKDEAWQLLHNNLLACKK
jgi:1-acyl-sn-glycerol-3-phosphate acyltransferase